MDTYIRPKTQSPLARLSPWQAPLVAAMTLLVTSCADREIINHGYDCTPWYCRQFEGLDGLPSDLESESTGSTTAGDDSTTEGTGEDDTANEEVHGIGINEGVFDESRKRWICCGSGPWPNARVSSSDGID